MRIAVVDTADPAAEHTWSGIPWHVVDGFTRAGHDVQPVGPLPAPFPRFHRVVESGTRRISGRRYVSSRQPRIVRSQARHAQGVLYRSPVDLVVAMGAPLAAFMRPGAPVMIWADATLNPMVGFYPEFSDWWPRSVRLAEEVERRALRMAMAFVGSSDWACASAQAEYGLPSHRVHRVQFGANLFGKPPEEAHVSTEGLLRLLCVGVDWHRKGFDIALDAAARLTKLGVPVHLDVVGCQPPESVDLPPWVTLHGFVSKTEQSGKDMLSKLFAAAHFLVLPSRAECAAIVVAEAAAHGVPTISANIGGMASVVQNGVTGMLLAPESTGDDYAMSMHEVVASQQRYLDMRHAARRFFMTDLNWDTACARVISLARELAPLPP